MIDCLQKNTNNGRKIRGMITIDLKCNLELKVMETE